VFSDDPNWALAPWRVAKNESGAVIRRAARVYAMSVEKKCPPTGIAKLVQYLMQRILVREVFDDFFPIRNGWPERKRASLASESVEAGQKSGWEKLLLIRLGIVRPNSVRMTGNTEVIPT
jgi:hypothetical protein